jgi:hypothetical protein
MCDTRQSAATGKNTNNEQQNYREPGPFVKGQMVLNGSKINILKEAHLKEKHPSSKRDVFELSTRCSVK